MSTFVIANLVKLLYNNKIKNNMYMLYNKIFIFYFYLKRTILQLLIQRIKDYNHMNMQIYFKISLFYI